MARTSGKSDLRNRGSESKCEDVVKSYIPVCCRCNKLGSCKNCCCIKTKHFCHGCLPGRLGKCNTASSDGKVNESPDDSTLALQKSTSHSVSPSSISTALISRQPRSSSTESEPPDLPPFYPAPPPDFKEGPLAGQECVDSINNCYNVVVHWVRNLYCLEMLARCLYMEMLARCLYKSYFS